MLEKISPLYSIFFLVVVFLPFVATVINFILLWNKKLKKMIEFFSIGSLLISFLALCLLFVRYFQFDIPLLWEYHFSWLKLLSYHFTLHLRLDSLGMLFSLVVLFISLLIHLYSLHYFKQDADKLRPAFFTVLTFFTGSMITLIF